MVIQAPRELIESMAQWQLPPRVDALLQELMDRHNEGLLSNEEREDFGDLVEFRESLAEYARGQGKPAKAALQRLRTRLGISPIK